MNVSSEKEIIAGMLQSRRGRDKEEATRESEASETRSYKIVCRGTEGQTAKRDRENETLSRRGSDLLAAGGCRFPPSLLLVETRRL